MTIELGLVILLNKLPGLNGLLAPPGELVVLPVLVIVADEDALVWSPLFNVSFEGLTLLISLEGLLIIVFLRA